MKRDWEKAEVLSAFFASNFAVKACAQPPRFLRLTRESEGMKQYPQEERDHLTHLVVHKSVDPDQHAPKGVRGAGRCCCTSIIFERSE